MIQLLLNEEQQRLITESIEPVENIGPSITGVPTVLHGYTESELRDIAEEAQSFTPWEPCENSTID